MLVVILYLSTYGQRFFLEPRLGSGILGTIGTTAAAVPGPGRQTGRISGSRDHGRQTDSVQRGLLLIQVTNLGHTAEGEW